MGYDQAQLLPSGFIDRLLLMVGDLGLKPLQDIHKLPIASGGYGQNKLQRTPLTELDGLQRLDVVKRQQPPIGHDDQSTDMRESFSTFVSVGKSVGASA